jgi:hypothetical protein
MSTISAMRSLRKYAILDAYQLLLAIFLFGSPWLFALVRGPDIDDWLSAIIVAAVSFAAFVSSGEWQEWTNFILGLWISASPWILGFQHTGARNINLAVGALIAYLAILELWLIHYGSPSERPQG